MNDELKVKDKKQKSDQQIQELEARVKTLEDQLKRAMADYQNLEKRIVEGRSELSNWATSELIKKLLSVLDHLEKALGGMSEGERASGWAKGVELAVNELKNVLKSEGLDQIAVDGQFDPTLHEAVDMKEGEDNTILEVVRIGYTLNGKVLRPAQVVVGKENN